jgi:hypothetical protein
MDCDFRTILYAVLLVYHMVLLALLRPKKHLSSVNVTQ